MRCVLLHKLMKQSKRSTGQQNAHMLQDLTKIDDTRSDSTSSAAAPNTTLIPLRYARYSAQATHSLDCLTITHTLPAQYLLMLMDTQGMGMQQSYCHSTMIPAHVKPAPKPAIPTCAAKHN